MFAALIVGKKSPNSSKVVLTACPTSGKNRRSLCGSKMKVDTVSEMKLSLQESFRKQVCCDGGGLLLVGVSFALRRKRPNVETGSEELQQRVSFKGLQSTCRWMEERISVVV